MVIKYLFGASYFPLFGGLGGTELNNMRQLRVIICILLYSFSLLFSLLSLFYFSAYTSLLFLVTIKIVYVTPPPTSGQHTILGQFHTENEDKAVVIDALE
jgi:hypothetical protein